MKIISVLNNIRVKLMLMVSLVVIFSSLLVVILLIHYTNYFLINRIASITANNLQSHSGNLNYFLEEAYYEAIKIQTDQELILILDNLNNSFEIDKVMELHDVLQNTAETNLIIDSIYIYLPMNEMVISSDRIKFYHEKVSYDKAPWINQTGLNLKDSQHLYELTSYEDQLGFLKNNYIGITKAITSNNGTVIGIVNVNIKEEMIYKEVLKSIVDYPRSKIYLVNHVGEIISSNERGEMYSSLIDLGIKDNMQNYSGGYYIDDISGEKSVIVFMTNRISGYSLVYVLPLEVISYGIDVLKGIAILLLTSGVTIAVIVLYFVLSWFYQPISILKKAMKLFESGNFEARIKQSRKDEFKLLYDGFNNMAEGVSNLMDKTIEQKIRINREYYKTLQTQISPHFTYNTLYSIKCIAMVEGNPKTFDMLTAFIELLHISTDNNSDLIPLYQEIKQVENYVILQKHRYGDCFNIEYDIAAEFQDKLVPKLILQPLIENSLKYGVDLKEGNGNICIQTYSNKNGFIIEVFDNGKQSDIKKIEGILSSEKVYFYSEIGINNVNNRIKLIYGDEYGLEFIKQDGIGLTVKVKLGNEPMADYDKIK